MEQLVPVLLDLVLQEEIALEVLAGRDQIVADPAVARLVDGCLDLVESSVPGAAVQ